MTLSHNQHDVIADVCLMLKVHTPADQREQESITEFLRVVPTLHDPCNEHADAVHVTASGIIVSNNGDKVALHLHKRLNMWLQPGGHIDAGETPAEAALREAIEETGLQVRHERDGAMFVHVDVHAGPKGHTHHDVRYLLRAPETPCRPAAGESQVAQWFSWDAAIEVADPGLSGCLVAVKALLGNE
jgi:8-oxo-dGTP pyrophosphatase MutT (NUDIX family)